MSGTTKANEQLALSAGLTAKTNQLCLGLESGAADILELVTPTTAELLQWWFGEDMVLARGGLKFHTGQKQAILNAIVAHEVLGQGHAHWTLLDLYRACAPDALLAGTRLGEVAQDKHAHPKYCFKMATGAGKTWVLQALLIWQLLNKTAALAEGLDDARFTRQFMVVAPGLIVYERLLDAFCGKLIENGNGSRDFATSDIAQFADLFIPDAYRETVFAFVRGNVCGKAEIGLKATGNGMVAITNWHLLAEGEVPEEIEEVEALGAPLEPQQVIDAVLPLTPGRATGNSLDVLDRRYARGNVLEFLAQLPELMVFNDEAHHIHEFKREGETTEVEWQKSLSRIAESKGRRFVQVDFSATPYNDVGSGKNKRKLYFPHIITDFDLKDAMRAGLVKSLVLDRRKEIGALPLEFKAERDDDGNPILSEGQRVMLRAGLKKLRKLEADFARLDPARHPKMLVVCEDTTVSPLVNAFLQDEGLTPDDVMTIDSGKKAELGEKDWAPLRERLFSVDRHASPRVIVSVLMLREGFDVNNICVIVPLRTSQAQILLEQTIGRGLRLMWRDDEYTDLKRENRERINAGQEPGSLLDVLSIVEHPAFQSFYDDLIQEGLAGATGDDMDDTSATGDVIAAELREGFEAFDFGIPFILREADEVRDHHALDLAPLPTFTAMTVEQLSGLLGKGDTFISQDLQSATLFGDYRVDGAVMNVGGYNDYLARLTRRISQALSEPLPKGNKVATHLAKPYLQVNTAELTGWLDDYIWTQLFGATFNPLDGENWRVLLLQPVVDHITKVFAVALLESEQKHVMGQTEVHLRHLSEVPRLMVRESHSVEVSKCIYTRLAWPAQSGGLERTFIHWAQADTQVQAFCKISENRHTFARLRYVKDDGLPAFYSPDFLVRTADAVYLVETKAQQQTIHPNVQRKLKAAVAWCERINGLSADQRSGLPWHYVLLAENVVVEWQGKGARLAGLLDYARLRPLADASLQERLI
ncbi:DEAD/DEAH box helicase family protein [Rhodoferax sediminis]|jgi:type III restriction enzyme|uniref:Restriction endonuclease subunit R n=1 Tax=Rhodoferax sediminis TaxID=2509614 RepID=A0A515DEV3_9BURK|nr:DEAD/DEAH box helicase family protein [Rhodoferax sediminis]QDL38956.1 restriction endonuclease subunit R [Rhodoferax sediminis]